MVLTRMVFNAPADNSRYSTLNTDRNPKLKLTPYFYYFWRKQNTFSAVGKHTAIYVCTSFPRGSSIGLDGIICH